MIICGRLNLMHSFCSPNWPFLVGSLDTEQQSTSLEILPSSSRSPLSFSSSSRTSSWVFSNLLGYLARPSISASLQLTLCSNSPESYQTPQSTTEEADRRRRSCWTSRLLSAQKSVVVVNQTDCFGATKMSVEANNSRGGGIFHF